MGDWAREEGGSRRPYLPDGTFHGQHSVHLYAVLPSPDLVRSGYLGRRKRSRFCDEVRWSPFTRHRQALVRCDRVKPTVDFIDPGVAFPEVAGQESEAVLTRSDGSHSHERRGRRDSYTSSKSVY